MLISHVKLCFSDATHVSVARERDWRGLFAVRYEVEKKHCISFLQLEREQIKRRKLERNAARGKATPDTAAYEKGIKNGTMGDMEKEYWIDRTTRKRMTGIKRTMEALKYIAWGEILREKALDALDEMDTDEALKLFMVACEEFHSGYSLLPANHSRMPNTVKDWAKALVRRMRLMKEKEQREAQQAEGGKELEDCELSPDLYDQITQLWNRSNEIYESSLRIGASNFDPTKRAELFWAYGHSLLEQARRYISGKRQTILDPAKEQELVHRALAAFDKAVEADIADGLEDYEVAYGVKTCVHSIFTYNTWRDRCLPAPAHDALIHELWEECHRRIKRTLRADSDLFAQMERELGPLTEVKAQGSATDLTKEQEEEEAGDELKPPPEDPNKFYLCDFDMECHIEWASIVYTQTLRFNRPETMDKVFKGLALAKSILQCALEELEDDDVDWMGLVKGNLGLCYLRMAKLSNEPQVQEEGYRLAEVYFRESEAQNDDSLYNLASLYALRGRTAECEACLRSCLEANNLQARELVEDDDLSVIRNEEWFPQLVAEAKLRNEEQRKADQEEKRKKRKGIDEWASSSSEEEDDEEGEDLEDADFVVRPQPMDEEGGAS